MADKAKTAAAKVKDEAAPAITPVTPTVPDPVVPPEAVPDKVTFDFGKFLPAEAGPILAMFQGPFSTAKLWAFCDAAAKLGPKVEAFIHANFTMKGDVPVTGPVDVPFTQHFAAFAPASTISDDELVQQFHAACGCPQGTTGEDATKFTTAIAEPVTMGPVAAGILAALIRRAAEILARRLAGG